MATSFISMNQKQGFWISDSFMQVICWGIVHSIDSCSDVEFAWMKGEFRDHIYHCSQGLFVGFIDLSLDEYLVDDKRKSQMKICIEKTKTFFVSKGEFIPVEELNSFQRVPETKVNWTLPLSTKIPLKGLTFMIEIIDGKWQLGIGDEIDWIS
ncbi:MAG: hypothetical protein ACTHMC_18520 [Pseudobacter sp.]|uniref:hypothetical protein n=1 Tax=Pseudobacter sp. TaxID=2045420 RepID=UPI003F7D3237